MAVRRKIARVRYLQIWLSIVLTGGLVIALGLVQANLLPSVAELVDPTASRQSLAARPVAAATVAHYRPLVDPPVYAPLAQVTPAAARPVATTIPEQPRPLVDPPVYAPVAQVTPLMPVTVTPLPFVIHTVQQDETVFSVAAHYGVTAKAVLAINKFKDALHLESGQAVLIPGNEHSFQVKILQHQTGPGETLPSIAAKYGSSPVTIQAANPQLESGALRPGEAIAVPIVLPGPKPAISAPGIATPVYHTVQTGEVPLKIAAQYDIPVEILLAANDIADPSRLRLGQRLMIPTHQGLSQAEILAVKAEPDLPALSVGQTALIPIIFGPQPARSAVISIPFSPIPPPPALLELQTQMVAAVNAERAAAGLPSLHPDETLAAVALGHAQDMVLRDFAAHINPDGQSPRDRIKASGIKGIKRVGENIQLNTWPAAHTVRAAVDWFMDSPPHRLNMLDRHYTHLGVAAVHDTSGWYTFVLEFAAK